MNAYVDVPMLLGLGRGPGQALSAFDLIGRVEKGLPTSALDRLCALVAPDEPALRYRIVPKATYMRRKKSRRLSAAESADVARLARVWAFAREVWGSDSEARSFLTREHPLLEDRRPIDVAIRSEIGARLVEEVLGGLAYGTAA